MSARAIEAVVAIEEANPVDPTGNCLPGIQQTKCQAPASTVSRERDRDRIPTDSCPERIHQRLYQCRSRRVCPLPLRPAKSIRLQVRDDGVPCCRHGPDHPRLCRNMLNAKPPMDSFCHSTSHGLLDGVAVRECIQDEACGFAGVGLCRRRGNNNDAHAAEQRVRTAYLTCWRRCHVREPAYKRDFRGRTRCCE